MSYKEQKQVGILESIERGKITQKEGAAILGMSVRQIIRRLKRYVVEGVGGLVHKSRGRPSNRALSLEIRQRIVDLLLTKYKGFGPTFAAEKLAENEGIVVNHETVRRIMLGEGLTKKRIRKNNPFVWREPKHHFGELIQVDGSHHRWFGEHNEEATLLAFIDDATNKIELLFSPEETTEGLANLTALYIKKHGRPRALYSDKYSAYRNNNEKDKSKRKPTQFGRMLGELAIEIFHANTPQAKGRVERLFKTLQDRLAKELKLLGIESIEKANKYLQKVYIDKHNKKFEKQPKSEVDLHQPIEGYDLNSIFCIKRNRILNSDNTIQYGTKWFQLSKQQPIPLYKKSVIQVCESIDKTIILRCKGHRLDYRQIEKRPEKAPVASVEHKVNNRPQKPPANHPWRDGVYARKSDISKKLKT